MHSMKNSKINIVLYRSIYPRNVGMCARAMANMGVNQLILVEPRCSIDDEFAKQGAAHAQSVLQQARIYKSHSEFQNSEGEGVRIALSGKDGRLKRPTFLDMTLNEIANEREHPFHHEKSEIYLMFGPEDDGLSNEEMELSHHICRLPTFGEITSLNLSHAVLLALYMVQTTRAKEPAANLSENAISSADDRRILKRGPVYYPSDSIHAWLNALGFDLSSRRVTIEKTLNRILLSRCPNEEELRIIDNVLQQTVRKLKMDPR